MSIAFENDAQVLSNYQQQIAFFCSQVTRVSVVAGAVSLSVSAFFGYGCLYPVTIAGFCFCAWAGIELSQTPTQEILNQKFKSKLLSFLPQSVRQYLDNSYKWVEFMHWPPVSNDHTKPPPQGVLGVLKSIFLSSPKEYVEVRAFTNGVSLKYETLNLQTQAKSSGDIQLVRPIEEMIELLKNCVIALENNSVPVFSCFHYTLPTTDRSETSFYYSQQKSTGSEVKLLLRSNDLIWNIYDNKLNKVISTQQNSLSYRCSEDTRNFFNNARRDLLIDRINLVKECVLYKHDSYTVYLEPIHQSSGFNKDILISKFMWTVTLIRNNGPSGNHAIIIVEGINDGFFPEEIVPIGKYFMCLTDLVGEKEIEEQGKKRKVRAIRISVKTEFNVTYLARGAVWKRPSKSVKNMILDIVKERDNPPSGFSTLGRDSVLISKGDENVVMDSCITWAIDRLSSIGIVLEKATYSYLFTNTSLFTPFKPDQKEYTFDTFLFFFVSDSKLI